MNYNYSAKISLGLVNCISALRKTNISTNFFLRSTFHNRITNHAPSSSIKNNLILEPLFGSKICTAGFKTSSTASKRFIRVGSGALKYLHAGKKHLNRGKSRVRLNRLSKTGLLKGVWLKKMNKLIR